MKGVEVKEKFIELRSQGLSFERITKELETSKPTLMKWAKEFENEISELVFVEFESLLEKYKMLKIERVRRYGEQLQLIRDALKKSELKDVSANKLLDMALLLEDKIKDEMKDVSHASIETKESFDALIAKPSKHTWHIE